MNWISVHDRLPRDGQRVLVWYGGDEFDVAVFDKLPGQFHRNYGYCQFEVTHWAEVKGPEVSNG